MEYCPFKFLYYILSSRRMQLYWFKALSSHQYSIMLWTCIDRRYIAVNKTVLIRCNARGNFFKSPQLNSVLMSRRPFLYLQPIACNLHSPPRSVPLGLMGDESTNMQPLSIDGGSTTFVWVKIQVLVKLRLWSLAYVWTRHETNVSKKDYDHLCLISRITTLSKGFISQEPCSLRLYYTFFPSSEHLAYLLSLQHHG